MLVLDSTLMETAIPKDARAPHTEAQPQTVLRRAIPLPVMAAAKLLVNAENPVLIAGDCVHSDEGAQQLIELAEALQIPVIDHRPQPGSRIIRSINWVAAH